MREPVIPQLSEREFVGWEAAQDRKFELHRGFVLAFAGGTIAHDQIAFNVRSLLAAAYEMPCRSFGSDVKVRVAYDTFYYADAGIVCDTVDDEAQFVQTPVVVVEVLSRSTRAFDLVEKRAAYRALPSLRAYAIVHIDMRRIEIDSRSGDGAWRTETFDAETAFIDGREVRLDAVYARTSR